MVSARHLIMENVRISLKKRPFETKQESRMKHQECLRLGSMQVIKQERYKKKYQITIQIEFSSRVALVTQPHLTLIVH